jgi:hypothetical protein
LVPLSLKRHRLHNHEIPEVVKGLILHLEQLLEKKDNRKRAETVFRTLYRITSEKPGRPKYPEFNWDFIEYYIENFPQE